MSGELFGWVGVIIGIIGIFLAIFTLLFTQIWRSLSTLRDEVRSLAGDIQGSLREDILTSPNLFLAALAKEARFWEKLSIKRADKVLIAYTICSKYIEENDNYR